MFDAVSTVIPGATRPHRACENTRAAQLPPLDEATMEAVADFYGRSIASAVHHRW
jgi:hypothetical protein